MPLQFQNINIPFAQGLDTKTDEKLVSAGKLLDLQNGIFTEGQKIKKRPGTLNLGRKDVSAGSTLTNGDDVATYNSELIEFADDRLYSYTEGRDAWKNMGEQVSYSTTTNTIIDNNYEQSQPDMYTLSGVNVVAWEDGRGGVRTTVVDQLTGAHYITDLELSATGDRVRVIGIGPHIFVWYRETGTLFYRRLNVNVPTTFEAAKTVKSDLNSTNPHYDVAKLGMALVVTYNDSSNEVHIFYWIPDDEILGTAALGLGDEVTLTGEEAEDCLNITVLMDANSISFPYVAYHNTTQGVRTTGRNADLTALFAPATLEAAPVATTDTFVDGDVNTGNDRITMTGHPFAQNDRIQLTTTGVLPAGLALATNYWVNVVNVNTISLSATFGPGSNVDITAAAGGGTHTVTFQNEKAINICGLESSNTQVKWWWEVDKLLGLNHFIRTNTVTDAGVIGTAADFVRGAGLALEAFFVGTKTYIGVAFDTDLQPTNFLLTDDAVVIGKWHQAQAGGVTTSAKVPRISSPSTNNFSFASIKKDRLTIEDSVFLNLGGINKVNFEFDFDNKFDRDVLGKTMLTAGSMLYEYDGANVVESGFHVFPENIVAVSQATGGSMSDGTYQLVATYEYMDAKGQRYVSAPSIPFSITLSGGGSAQQINTITSALRMTAKTNVTVHLYSTEGSGSLFYRVTSVSSPTFNDKTADIIQLDRTIDDATLVGNELLYTTGGVLDNIAPLPASIVIAHQNRFYTAGLEDPNEFQFSQPYIKSQGILFNDTLTRRVEQEGGKITALASMDDKFIMFKENRIYVQVGFGPNLTGLQSDFSNPTLITTDVGCTDPKSVVDMPQGVMFKSDKGIYLLTRSLDAVYIGADVEDFNNEDITSAILVEGSNEVRFTTKEGRALVFNYFYQQWSTFTNYSAEGATLWKGVYVHVKPDAIVKQETPTVFLDNGQFYKLLIQTAWIKLHGLQNFQRVRKMSILGEYRSDHKLTTSLFYDYADSVTNTIIFNATNILADEIYGGDATYGDSTVYGGDRDDGVYQFRAHMPRQKCQSVKFQFEDEASTANIGESFTLSDLTLEVGMKRGINKLPPDKTL